jgi:hypothetical protein
MHGKAWIAALAAAALAACSQGGAPANNATAAPANTAAAAPVNNTAPAGNSTAANSAAATPAAGPAPAYVTALLAVLNSTHPDKYAQDPSFAKLITENGRLAGQSGAGVDLDSDPVCQCQDSGGHYVYVSGAAEADGSFDAKLQDTAETDSAPWTVVLKQENGAWVVYNVIDAAGDNRVWLARHNDCMRRIHGSDDALLKCFGDQG